jgi:hypothetical protein
VRAIDAIAFRTQHEVVAGGAPRRLLGDFDIRHAVFGEQPLVLGDEQRPRVAQRDEPERCLGDFRTRPLREGAGGEVQLGGGKQGRRAAGRLQELAAAETAA